MTTIPPRRNMNPIRVFWSPLTRRLYATRSYREVGPGVVEYTGRRYDVTNDIAEAVKAAKGGQVEFRAEKAGLVHAGVGKASFTKEALIDNVKAFVGAVAKAKPSGAKGSYIKKVSLSSTMGPGVKLEIASVLG